MTKLFALAPHSVVALAGAAELGVALMSEVEGIFQQQPTDGVTSVMNAVRERTRQRYAEWFPGWQIQPTGVPGVPPRPDLNLTVAGYDPDGDGAFTVPKIYQLISGFDFAPMLTATGFALQGIVQYGLYLMNRLYVPDASIGDLKALAAYVITETASQDGKVGGPVQMAIVTTAEGCTILDPADVEGIVDGNRARSDQLRASW
jgi:hypothetical protein